jgi:phosphate acetyltransferase
MTMGTVGLCQAIDIDPHNPGRLVFVEGSDPRVLRAACEASLTGLADPILLGSRDDIEQTARRTASDLDLVEVLDPQRCDKFDEHAQRFAELRQIPLLRAHSMTCVPFYYAAMMLDRGEAEAMIVGASCSNSEVVMACELALGTREGVDTPSSYAVLEFAGRRGGAGQMLAMADFAVNPEPSALQLADISLTVADSVEEVLGWDARVALLSHSTHGHPLEPCARHVCEAIDLVRQRAPGLKVDGDLQLDAAINATVARHKLSHSGSVAGRANVLIFPDMSAGNIAVKLAHELADAVVCGPVLEGFAGQVGLLSRSSTARDVLGTIALTLGHARAGVHASARSPHSVDLGARARRASRGARVRL